MADQNYEQWLKDREVELAGTRQLTGVDRATPEQPKISRLRQAAAITPLIKPAGGVYTLPDSEVSKYDEELPLGSDITDLNVLLQNRADSQSILSKVLNSTVGGVASGILTAGETVGYIMDIPHYISKLLGAEGQEDNMVSKAFRDMKKDLYTNVPVYEDVETSGALDSFFR